MIVVYGRNERWLACDFESLNRKVIFCRWHCPRSGSMILRAQIVHINKGEGKPLLFRAIFLFFYSGIVSKLPTQAWNKAKISPHIPLKTALSERENHCTNDAFWLVESRDAYRLHRPYIDPTSTLQRPHIDLTSTSHRPHIDPISSTFIPCTPWINQWERFVFSD